MPCARSDVGVNGEICPRDERGVSMSSPRTCDGTVRLPPFPGGFVGPGDGARSAHSQTNLRSGIGTLRNGSGSTAVIALSKRDGVTSSARTCWGCWAYRFFAVGRIPPGGFRTIMSRTQLAAAASPIQIAWYGAFEQGEGVW